uniref:Ig-like domain-containing protein n=1 Tax=Leptobrachium leishanense TaxID=445787 RepID=A0A8C5PZS4_9ANUR
NASKGGCGNISLTAGPSVTNIYVTAALSRRGIYHDPLSLYISNLMRTKKLFKKNIPFSPAPPEVKVSGRHVDINKESVLSCLITGFYPADIDIKWFKEDKIMDHVSENTPQRNPIGTCTARLDFIPSYKSDEGAEFICRVEHPSLKEPILRRTKPLHVMGECVNSQHLGLMYSAHSDSLLVYYIGLCQCMLGQGYKKVRGIFYLGELCSST